MFKTALLVVAIGLGLGCGGDVARERTLDELLRDADSLENGKADGMSKPVDRASLCKDLRECLESYNTGNNKCGMSALDAQNVANWRIRNCDDLPYCSQRNNC